MRDKPLSFIVRFGSGHQLAQIGLLTSDHCHCANYTSQIGCVSKPETASVDLINSPIWKNFFDDKSKEAWQTLTDTQKEALSTVLIDMADELQDRALSAAGY